MEFQIADPNTIPDHIKDRLLSGLREQFGPDAIFEFGSPEEYAEGFSQNATEGHKAAHVLGFSPNDYTQKPLPVHAVQYHAADGADRDDNFLVVAQFCKDRGIAFAVTPRGCLFIAQNVGHPDYEQDCLEDTDFLVYRPDTKQAAITTCDDFRRDFELSKQDSSNLTEKDGENTEFTAADLAEPSRIVDEADRGEFVKSTDEGHTYPADTHAFKPGEHKYLAEEDENPWANNDEDDEYDD